MGGQNNTLLLATVGTGRCRSDIAEAILFSLRGNEANRAAFLCSKKTQKETLPLLLEKLDWSGDRYRVHCCADEEDVQRSFIEWNEAWDGWKSALESARVIVDFTSGTKPMSAAAFALAIARGAETVSYVVGDRDSTGRATRSSEIRSIAPDVIIGHRQLRLAVEHFHAASYAAARDVAKPYLMIDNLPDERLRETARSVNFIAKAYEAWDRFDWKEAKMVFRETKRFWSHWPWVENIDLLAANAGLVEAAEGCRRDGDFGPALCADLLANVDRCIHRQGWDDAVARLYRACELLAQLKLLRDHGQRTNDIDPAKLPQSIRREYTMRKKRGPAEKLKLGLEHSFTLLEQLKDPLGIEFRRQYGQHPHPGPLQRLLNARNGSLLAHGVQPIKAEKAEKLREHVTALADIADPDIQKVWLVKSRPVRFQPF